MQNCKICGEGLVKYTGKGYWFKCDTCGVTEAYVDYYNNDDMANLASDEEDDDWEVAGCEDPF